MSYTVTIRGGKVYSLDDDAGFDLKAQRAEADKPFLVELEEDQYSSSQIVSITKNKITYSAVPNYSQSTLPVGKVCRGERSIQKEINNIIKDQYPDWSQRIRDTTEREKIRKELLPLGKDWCDIKTGSCACG